MAIPILDEGSQKFDAVIRTMADLSSQMKDLSDHVEDTEDRQKEVEASPTSLSISGPARKRASLLGSANLDQDMAKVVHRHVAKWPRQLPAY